MLGVFISLALQINRPQWVTAKTSQDALLATNMITWQNVVCVEVLTRHLCAGRATPVNAVSLGQTFKIFFRKFYESVNIGSLVLQAKNILYLFKKFSAFYQIFGQALKVIRASISLSYRENSQKHLHMFEWVNIRKTSISRMFVFMLHHLSRRKMLYFRYLEMRWMITCLQVLESIIVAVQ